MAIIRRQERVRIIVIIPQISFPGENRFIVFQAPFPGILFAFWMRDPEVLPLLQE